MGETVFIAFFVAWTLFRLFDPNIAGTEKPMDFMFLNASVVTESAPPEDPWLSGEPVRLLLLRLLDVWRIGQGQRRSAGDCLQPRLVSFGGNGPRGAIFTLCLLRWCVVTAVP